MMFNFISVILEGLGNVFGRMGCNACIAFWVEEPKCPKSLIK